MYISAFFGATMCEQSVMFQLQYLTSLAFKANISEFAPTDLDESQTAIIFLTISSTTKS